MKNDKLIAFRKSKGLTLQQMADKLSITKSMYEKLEYGDANPSIATLQRFADNFEDFDIEIFLKLNHNEFVDNA